MLNEMIGKKVIVIGDRSGVFFGTLAEKQGREVVLTGCRRLWYWDGACSISQLAVDGTKASDDCKFTVTVDEIGILEVVDGVQLCMDCINEIANRNGVEPEDLIEGEV